jgi:hypothetical protein
VRVQQRNKALAVGGLQLVGQLVHDHVFQQIFGLFDQFGVEPDIAQHSVAAAPLGLHALKKGGLPKDY